MSDPSGFMVIANNSVLSPFLGTSNYDMVIYTSTSNQKIQLGTTTNTMAALTINGGNVGIDNAAPAYALDVAGSMNFSGSLLQNGIVFKTSQFSTSSDKTSVYITNSNVGIGKSNPSYPLDVNGSVNFTGNLLQNGSAFKTSQFSTSYDNTSIYIINSNVGIGKSNPAYPLDVNGSINFTGNILQNGSAFKTSQFSTSSDNTSVYITNSNVGIGKSNPAYPLDVNGSVNFSGNLLQNGSAFKTSQFSTSSDNTSVYITNSNVGIGKSNPSYALDVAGTVNATTILIGGQPISAGGGSINSSGSIVPASNGVFDLGSSNNAFRTLYLTQGAVMRSGPTTTVITPTDWSVLANYVIPTAQLQLAQTYTAAAAIKLFSGMSQDHSVYVVNGLVYMFGNNNVGQLGFGNTNQTYTVPTLAASIQSKPAVSVCLGNQYTCVVFNDGTAMATGINVSGQLGNGNLTAQTSFVPVVLPTGFFATKVVCGWDCTLYMGTLNGATVIYGYGNNSQGQLGNGTTSSTNTTAVLMTLTALNGTSPMTVAVGGYHTVVVDTSGTLYGCGWNSQGQLGMDSTLYPYKTSLLMLGTISGSTITSIGPIIRVACGKLRTVAIKLDGTVYTTGNNALAFTAFSSAVPGLNQGGSMDLAVGQGHELLKKERTLNVG